MALIRLSLLLLCGTTIAVPIGCGLERTLAAYATVFVGIGLQGLSSRCQFPGFCGASGNLVFTAVDRSIILEITTAGDADVYRRNGDLVFTYDVGGVSFAETVMGLRLYVAAENGLVEWDEAQRGLPTNVIAVAGCGAMGDVVVLPDNRVLVTCPDARRLVEIDVALSSEVESFSCCEGVDPSFDPIAIALAPDGSVLAGTAQINRFDGQTGGFLGVAVETGVNGATSYDDFVFGPNGNLFVSANPNIGVLEFDGVTFDFLGVFVPSGAQGIDRPTGLAFDEHGDLFVGGARGTRILQFDGQSGELVGEVIRLEEAVVPIAFMAFRP